MSELHAAPCLVANHVPFPFEINVHVHVKCHVPAAVDVDIVILIFLLSSILHLAVIAADVAADVDSKIQDFLPCSCYPPDQNDVVETM